MKTLAEKRWTRVLAAILFCVFLFSSAFCYMVIRYSRSCGWYTMNSADGFEDTMACKDYIWNGLYYVEQNVRWMNDPSAEYLGSYAGRAFSYVIRIVETGEITADTRTDRSVFVDTITTMVPDLGIQVYLDGYVNLPVEMYDGCYAEYVMFDIFFGLRYWMIAFEAISMLLTLFCAAVLCMGNYRRGKEDKLPLFLQNPYDLVLLGGFIALLMAETICSSLLNSAGETVRHFIFSTNIYALQYSLLLSFKNVYISLVLSVLVWYLCGQLGAGILREHLISRRLMPHIPREVLVYTLIGIHLILLFFLRRAWLYGWYDQTIMNTLGILVLAADILLLLFLIPYLKGLKHIEKAMSELSAGNLSYKIEEKKLHFIWRKLGQDVNHIGDGMAQAVEDRMRSERMKTELITNVSHDLKTPVTSIVNYIDLLKQDTLDEQTRREYLDVLERQSGKLKKLTQDVVDASKAASGALTVETEPINVVELLEQFVGEYEERLKEAHITPIVSAPAENIKILADSALLGRVIENLITNVVKYAMPDTRAYFDLSAENGSVKIAIKNISREPLNISADELMERFVRGDSSRHSEGSGLGLSIANSLTMLMGGQMVLTLDGDLFKAELTFPQT